MYFTKSYKQITVWQFTSRRSLLWTICLGPDLDPVLQETDLHRFSEYHLNIWMTFHYVIECARVDFSNPNVTSTRSVRNIKIWKRIFGGFCYHYWVEGQFVSQCRSVPNQIDPRTGCGSVCYIYISVQSVCKFPWFWRHYHIEHVLVISSATHSIYEVPLSVGLCQWQIV